MPTVSRIPLAALQPDYGIAGEAYITACEALAVALSRNGVAVITLPSSKGQALGRGLQTLLANRTQALPGCLLRTWQAGEPAENAAIEQVGAEVCQATGAGCARRIFPGGVRVPCCFASQFCSRSLIAGTLPTLLLYRRMVCWTPRPA